MVKDWQELTRITNGVAFAFERVKLPDDEIIIEGSFELVEIESRLAQTEVLAQLEQATVGQASMGVSGCD
ncbi:MAG TPA: hypothetical protein DC056_14625 [Dehalococcoidia bacterium]|nr:hypothetical protein [Dehalococcoidia bacterium]